MIHAYEREPYRSRLVVQVLAVGEEDGRPYAVLDDTVLYPEGGGQPADRGVLGGVAVVDVQRRDDAVRHYLAAGVAEGPAELALDWRRRFDHMQQHTAQHLLSAIAADRFGWPTTSFHLGECMSDVELDVSSLSLAQMTELEEQVASEVRAARPIRARRVSPAEYSTLDVRTRGLPEGHTGDVRLVEIVGIDVTTCGGTHLESTAEVEAVSLLGTAPMRGGTRLYFVAGGRVRRRLAGLEAKLVELRRLLEASEEELADAARARNEQLRDSQRRVRALARWKNAWPWRSPTPSPREASRSPTSTARTLTGDFSSAWPRGSRKAPPPARPCSRPPVRRARSSRSSRALRAGST